MPSSHAIARKLPLGAKAGRVILAHTCDPDRICRLGSERLRAFVARQTCALSSARVPALILTRGPAAARRLTPNGAGRAGHRAWTPRGPPEQTLVRPNGPCAQAALVQIAVCHPRRHLTSQPGHWVPGHRLLPLSHPWRFPNAAAAYRASCLIHTETLRRQKTPHVNQHITTRLGPAP